MICKKKTKVGRNFKKKKEEKTKEEKMKEGKKRKPSSIHANNTYNKWFLIDVTRMKIPCMQ